MEMKEVATIVRLNIHSKRANRKVFASFTKMEKDDGIV